MKKLYFKKINKACPAKLWRSGGYTIIETMIAISLFIVIVMAGMGALLNANLLHNKSQNMRSIMDNLSFIMEDMSRNLRTGYDYICDGVIDDCIGGTEISFKATNPPGDWLYRIDTCDGKDGICKSVDDIETQLVPPEVIISMADSSFTVSGTLPGDNLQPFVTIKLVGTITLKNNIVTPFSLQTSVSQRVLDW